MDRGTYISTSGGMLQFHKLDVVNNNLANTNTPGFKRQLLIGSVQTFDQTLAKSVAASDPYAEGDHKRSPGTAVVGTATDFSAGPISSTGNPLDVALRNENDFFVVNTPNGTQYTRAGNFTLNDQGEVVTQDGYQVAGDGGSIATNGPGVKIAPNGAVYSNGVESGKIQVVHFDNPASLKRESGARFSLGAGSPAPTQVSANIVPESLEMSNVSAITGVIDLITANRGFEMYSKTLQTIDGMNQTAISQIGRPR